MRRCVAPGLALALLPVTCAAAGCLPVAAQAAASASQSIWREYDDSGERLLREEGVLRGVTVQLDGRCAGTLWSVDFAHEQGRRNYEGRTNRGRPLQTTASVETRAVRFGVSQDAGFAVVSVRVGPQWTRRSLASVGSVRGYTERYRFAEIDFGIGRSMNVAAQAVLDVELRVGWAPAGHIFVDLPTADRLRLRTGSTRLAALGAALSAPVEALGPTASWRLEIGASRRDTSGGPHAAIRQHGVIVGSARQPRMRVDATSVSLGVEWQF